MYSGIVCIRGLPGSGKSTLAIKMQQAFGSGSLASADDYFMQSGTYKFDPTKLRDAHANCRRLTRAYLTLGPVFIHNTFSEKWELEVYADMAVRHAVPFSIIDLFDARLTDAELAARNVHGVPVDTIAWMRDRWYRLATELSSW